MNEPINNINQNWERAVLNKLSKTVSVSREQNFTEEEKAQGRENLGIDSAGGNDPNAVHFTEQTLADAQKEQARENIGAGTYSKPDTGIPASDLADNILDGKQDYKETPSGQPSQYTNPKAGDIEHFTEVVVTSGLANVTSYSYYGQNGLYLKITDTLGMYYGSYGTVTITFDSNQSYTLSGNIAGLSIADGNNAPIAQLSYGGSYYILLTYDTLDTQVHITDNTVTGQQSLLNDVEFAIVHCERVLQYNGRSWIELKEVPDISGKEDTSNKVTAFQSTPDDTHYPSEKLVKDSLDAKQPTIDSSHKLPYSLVSGTPTIPAAVEANPTVPSGTTPTDLAGLKVGNNYYGIPQLPTVDNTPTANSNNLVKSSGVYSEVHPAVASAQPAGGMLPNVEYDLGTLTGNVTFALANAVSGITNHYYWTFDTGSTAPTITWPSGITWYGGSAPTINANAHYEISVLNSIGIFMEV